MTNYGTDTSIWSSGVRVLRQRGAAIDSQICAVLLFALAAAVNRYVPEPYMDEVFHVPQAQRYCRGDYTWDPKITTPPGIYIMSALLRPVFGCSTVALRFENALGLMAGCLVLRRLSCQSATLCLVWPLLAFYGLLYYTDVWANVLALAGLSTTIAGHYNWAALVLFVSTWFRQTNIVWAGYAAFIALCGPNLRPGVLEQLIVCMNRLVTNVSVPYLIVGTLFTIFVVLNGGITLGDKANHALSLHFAQLLYFALFSALQSVPLVLESHYIRLYFESWAAHPLRRVAEVLLIAGIIRFGTVVHPFVLADNRHYTFYLWRRLLHPSVPELAYAMVPVYHVAVDMLFALKFASPAAFYAFLGAVALVLVPSPLMEPRYYALPYAVWRLYLVPRLPSRVELAWNAGVLSALVAVFCRSEVHFMW